MPFTKQSSSYSRRRQLAQLWWLLLHQLQHSPVKFCPVAREREDQRNPNSKQVSPQPQWLTTLLISYDNRSKLCEWYVRSCPRVTGSASRRNELWWHLRVSPNSFLAHKPTRPQVKEEDHWSNQEEHHVCWEFTFSRQSPSHTWPCRKRETLQLSNVIANPKFQSDPTSAILNHLAYSIAAQTPRK